MKTDANVTTQGRQNGPVKKNTTLMFLWQGNRVLLAMKKRGFGAGKWNAPGGKVDPGETVGQAAIRECQEEIGVTPLNPTLVGRLDFYDENVNHDCCIYIATRWRGEPAESEEMRPQWFDAFDVPYDAMWAADKLWMPHILAGKSFEGKVVFKGDQLLSQTITVVPSLPQHA